MSAKRSIYNEDKANAVFAVKIRKLFEESGKTHSNLAEFIEHQLGESVTRQAVGQWCNGNTCPNLRTVPIIAEFFGVSTDYLLTDTKIRTTNIDVRAMCEHTGLSENSVKYLISKKKPLEYKVLDAIFEELGLRLLEVGHIFLNKSRIKAFDNALLKKFVLDANLPISEDIINQRGEKAIDYFYRNDEQLLYTYKYKFDRFCDEQKEKIENNTRNSDEKYQNYLLNDVFDAIASDAFLAFLYPSLDLDGSDILKYYTQYYQRLLECQNEAEKAELIIDEWNYYDELAGVLPVMPTEKAGD